MLTASERQRRCDAHGAQDAGGRRPRSRSRHAARPEDAALFGRADRHRAGAPARSAVLHDRAGAGGHQAAAPLRNLGRRARQPVLSLPHHRRWPRARDAVHGAQPLRRPRAGAARPVPRVHVQTSALRPRHVDRDSVRKAFSHLVISDRVLDQLGPAINAGHSMFVYGPPGNGKTVISQAIHNLLEGDIDIPHALEVEGSIIRFFDPVNHEPLPEPDDADGLDLTDELRSPLGALPPADGDGGRRADARSARTELQPDDGILPRAGAGGRQRRRAGHRRLRPAALLAARSVEPLDRAARKPASTS